MRHSLNRHILGEKTDRYQFVRYNEYYGVTRVCRLIHVSKSGYYAWKSRKPSKRSLENEKLIFEIRVFHEKSKKNAGSPKIFKALRKAGIECGKNRVVRLMRETGIRCKYAKKYKATTNSKHDYPVAENILKQHFVAVMPNEIWVGDITYVWTNEGWLYVSIVIDLYARKVVGLAMSEHIDSDLANAALKQAIDRRRPGPGLIYHTDRGSTYAADTHQEIVRENQLTMSMSRKGDPFDNAVSESTIGFYKRELVFDEKFETRTKAKVKTFEYFEVTFNRERLHSTNGYKTPEEFEAEYFEKKQRN